MTTISVGDEILHTQFGKGKITRVLDEKYFVNFDEETCEKIITPSFIVSINGAPTHFRDSQQKKVSVKTQKDCIYDLLVDAGPVGVNSNDLINITHRFSASIYVLRKEGHNISTKSNPDGSSTFVLKIKN